MAKHPAAFINEIAESGTKEDAIKYLQETWDILCDLREWHDINTVPWEVCDASLPILVHDGDGHIYITAWTDDVYKAQGGHGGPSGWFSGRYSDGWGDHPIFDEPKKWQYLPAVT